MSTTEDDDSHDESQNDLGLFAEEWEQIIDMGTMAAKLVCPDGERLRRKCDDPECAICGGVIKLGPGELDLGCGCGWSGTTRDGMTNTELTEAFESHECPLRGVDLSAEDIFDIVNDPGGHRRAHLSATANAVEADGYAVQTVFPTDPDHVWFGYTIGLWPAHAGELLVRGFGEQSGDLAAFFAGHVVNGTFPLTPGVHRFKPFDEDPSAKVRVDVWSGDPNDFGQAMAFHGTDAFARFHVVLADDDGRFPEDESCECAEYQMKGLDRG